MSGLHETLLRTVYIGHYILDIIHWTFVVIDKHCELQGIQACVHKLATGMVHDDEKAILM